MIIKSDKWISELPYAYIGILSITDAPNQSDHPDIISAQEDLEIELKELFGSLDRKSLRELPVFKSYDDFYRSFKKTYHVQRNPFVVPTSMLSIKELSNKA